jgi:hypothetical protein
MMGAYCRECWRTETTSYRAKDCPDPVMKILSTRKDRLDDLSWFFDVAESEMGFGSSWGALVQICKTGITRRVAVDSMSQKRFDATMRHREIREILASLSPSHRLALERVYERRQYPIEILSKFGPLAGISVHTFAARRGFQLDANTRPADETLIIWLAGAVCRDEKIIGNIRLEAERMYNDAHEAYHKAASKNQ